jgi:phosphocarrier protein
MYCISVSEITVRKWERKEMISRDIVINNTSGLHARPATFFIQKANSYRASIWIEKDDRKVNAKSLLGVLSLGIAKGMTVTLIADGQDEESAIAGLVELVNGGFSEA